MVRREGVGERQFVMWVLVVIGLFAGTFALMYATGAVLAVLHTLYLKAGNPGKLLRDSRRRPRGPGQGLYIEPQHDGVVDN